MSNNEVFCLNTQFEEVVNRNPYNIAIENESISYTYEKLNQYANQFAYYIKYNLKIEKTCIGIYMEKTINLPIVILAILKSGNTCVPLDISYPEERIKRNIELSNIKFVICEQNAIINNDAREVYSLEKYVDLPSINISNCNTNDTIAFVFNTSGTEAESKAVAISHRACCISQLPVNSYYLLSADDKIPLFSPVNFAGFKAELFWTLLSGATLHIISSEKSKNIVNFTNIVLKQGVTCLTVVPSMLKVILKQNLDRNKIKAVFCIGENLDERIVEDFYKKLPNAELYNIYGQTEISPISSYKCKLGDEGIIPVGKAVNGVKIRFCDGNTLLVDSISEGEICVAGDNLSSGYLKRNDLFMNKLLIHEGDSGKEIYIKTGDFGRKDDEGNLYVLSRINRLIKVNGRSINPVEIECILKKSFEIQNAIVTELNEGNITKIAAFLESDEELSYAIVMNKLNCLLPKYMIPDIFYMLEKFPIKFSGKVDLDSLIKSRKKYHEIRNNEEKVQNSLERRIAKRIENQLKISGIGIDETYFDIGGNSISIVELVCELEEEFDIKLNLQEFMDEQLTIRKIEKRIKEVFCENI